MNELITVTYNENKEPTVDARELQEVLGITKHFTNWIKERIEYLGLIEGVHYKTRLPLGLSEMVKHGGQNRQDYILSFDTAKNIAMTSRGTKAQEVRNYFITVEKAWHTPELVAARNTQLNNPNYPATIDINPLQKMFEDITSKLNKIEQNNKEPIDIIKSRIKINVEWLSKNYKTDRVNIYNNLYKEYKTKNPKINIYKYKEIYKDRSLLDAITDYSIVLELLKITNNMISNYQEIENKKFEDMISKMWD